MLFIVIYELCAYVSILWYNGIVIHHFLKLRFHVRFIICYLLFFCDFTNVATHTYFQVLESVIKYRWNALPVEQRDGIKNYISDVIVQVFSRSDLI